MERLRREKRSPNPKENVNVCSTITFFYALKTLWKGFKKEFTEDDICETLNEHRSENLGNTIEILWQGEVLNAARVEKQASLHKTLMKMLIFDFFLIGLALAVLFLIIRPTQAIALANLTKFSDTKEPHLVTNAALLITSTVLSVIIHHPCTIELMNIGLKMKIACSSLIYKKVLRLNLYASQQTSIGQIINLLTNDVNVFGRYITNLHYLWIGPFQTLFYSYLVYQYVGLLSTLGIVFLVLFTPIYLIMGQNISKYRLRASLKRDQRLRLTNEVIKGINTVKMQTLEEPLGELVSDSRKSELLYVRSGFYLKGFLHLQTVFAAVSLFIGVLVHLIFDNKIDADKIYLLTNLYNNLSYTMTTLFPQAIILMREAIVSIKRIQTFLLLEEFEKCAKSNQEDVAIALNNVTAKWDKSLDNAVLKDINIFFSKHKLSVIIGSVGSGKSTLLYTILNELNIIKGDLVINGSISYSSQEPWIFPGSIKENILFGSAIDAERYKTIIKICALDKDIEMLPYGDKTLVGENGASLSGGQKVRINLARTIYKVADTYLLDDPLASVDITVGKKIFFECIQQFLKGKTVILVTNHLHLLQDVDKVYVLYGGKILPNVQLEQNDDIFCTTRNKITKYTLSEVIENPPNAELELKTSGLVAWSTYKYYISGCKNYFFVFSAITFFILSQTSISATSYFVKYWVNLEQDQETVAQKHLIFIYFLLTTISVVLIIFKMLNLYLACSRASKTLHTTLLTRILNAKINFFSENSSGRILNRFSNDLSVIDEQLPSAIFIILQYSLSIVGSFILMATIKPLLIIPTLIIGFLFILFNSSYLSSTINLKRLEGITRSPVLEHLIALLRGLPTVRALGIDDVVTKIFHERQDLHSCTYHLTLTTSRAFGFWLDVICVCYIIITSLTVVIENNEKYGGDVGLLLTQALQLLGHFQLATKQCAEIENHMTSVERLREYTFIDQEESDKQIVKASWDEKGKIQFHNVYFKYPSSIQYVLKNVNFTIRPQEKIGIVGRTGSGKSTLVSALFRLIEVEGSITIDDINIKNIKLKSLRSKLSIIPQNPLLFSGTIRKNLDIFKNHQDEVLWKVLDEVSLKEVFTNLNLDLDSVILENGCNLSVGQKQLMCLARAILTKTKIVILDEVTANMDSLTDDIIQKVLREKFVDCTVLTVSHRLPPVMDSDRILVMDNGVVVEFDYPHVLLQNKNGLFRKMVYQTNKNVLKTLVATAENKYNAIFNCHEAAITKL